MHAWEVLGEGCQLRMPGSNLCEPASIHASHGGNSCQGLVSRTGHFVGLGEFYRVKASVAEV